MIKAICFDFDGVLTTDKSGSLTTLRSLSRQTGIAEDVLWEALRPFNDDLLLGRTTHARIWPQVGARLGHPLPMAALEIAFQDTPMNRPMLALARALRAQYAVGIITDNKADRMDFLCRQHGLANSFDPIVVSAEVGSGKDQPAIFAHALERLGVQAGECLFIDNTLKNLAAPAALGIKTLHFDDGRNDVEALRIAIAQASAAALGEG